MSSCYEVYYSREILNICYLPSEKVNNSFVPVLQGCKINKKSQASQVKSAMSMLFFTVAFFIGCFTVLSAMASLPVFPTVLFA